MIETIVVTVCICIVVAFIFYPMYEDARATTQQQFKTQPVILIGSKWVLNRTPGDPFPNSTTHIATVLEVKDGWVRYNMGAVFTDERKDIPSFLAIYTQVADI